MMNKLAIYACSGLAGRVGLVPDWESNATLKKYLSEGSAYFLYTYIKDADLYKYPTAVKEKRKGQLKIRRWIHDEFVPLYGTEQDFDQLIRENIVDTFNNKTVDGSKVHVSSPEEVLEKLNTGEEIGIATEIICAIISAVASLLLACIGYLVNYFQQKEFEEIRSKYVVPTEEEIVKNSMSAGDWGEEYEALQSAVNTKSTASSKWLLLALIPTAIMMLKKK